MGSGKLEDTGRPVAFVHYVFTKNSKTKISKSLYKHRQVSPSRVWTQSPFQRFVDGYSTLQGTDRVKVCEVVCKTPISLADLLSTRGKLNLSVQKDAIFGAVSLIMFFCL